MVGQCFAKERRRQWIALFEIACGAYAFALVAHGESSAMLSSCAWEWLIGGTLGLVTAMFALPFREPDTLR
jgi:hypothetical protein